MKKLNNLFGKKVKMIFDSWIAVGTLSRSNIGSGLCITGVRNKDIPNEKFIIRPENGYTLHFSKDDLDRIEPIKLKRNKE